MSDFDVNALFGEMFRSEAPPQKPSAVQQRANVRDVSTIRSAFTGENRSTLATDQLPELSQVGVGRAIGVDMSNPFDIASNVDNGIDTSTAMLTTFNPEEQIALLRHASRGPVRVIITDSKGRNAWFDASGNTPLSTTTGQTANRRPGQLGLPEGWQLGDANGNVIVESNGERYTLNKPGFSGTDAFQLGAGAAMFAPAGKAAQGMRGLQAMGRAGAAAGATQGAAEAAQSDAGGEFNLGDIAATSALAGGTQGLVNIVRRYLPLPTLQEYARAAGGRIDQLSTEARQQVIEMAVRLGVPRPQIDEGFFHSVMAAAKKAISPETVSGTAGSREFQVPLTSGQVSMDPLQLSREDSMRVGILGEIPQTILTDFQNAQNSAIDSAATRLQSGLSSTTGLNGGRIGQPSEAGGLVAQRVKEANAAADEQVSAGYGAVGAAQVVPKGAIRLFQTVAGFARRDPSFDRTLPQTAKVLEESRAAASELRRLSAQQAQSAQGPTLKPIDMQRIEQIRRRFGTAIDAATDNSDKRQVTQLKRAFDDELDGIVADGLISGDQGALDALKSARGLMTDYARRFFVNDKTTRGGGTIRDDAGRLVQKIVYGNPTDSEVVNALFGARAISAKAGEQIAGRMRQIIGTDSDAWDAIRQAGFLRIIQRNRVNGQEIISAQRSLANLDQALRENGGLMRSLYSDEEIGQMRRFLAVVKRTQPDIQRSRENPSGTTQVASKAIQQAAKYLTFVNEPVSILANFGIKAAQRSSQTAQANAAVRPFEQVLANGPGAGALTATGTAGGRAALQ